MSKFGRDVPIELPMRITLQDIAPDFETRRLYLHRRTGRWHHDGEERHWEIFVEFVGINKDGSITVIEHWRWNGSDYTAIESEYRLSKSETAQLLAELRATNGMEYESCVICSIE